jgi:tetratricopeptide (TPR) repeat protein
MNASHAQNGGKATLIGADVLREERGMEFVQSVKLEEPSVDFGKPDPTAQLNQERLIALTSWMMILGTIRAICAFADQASVFLKATRLDSVSWSMLNRFVDENQPFLAMGVAWPLLLGLTLRRVRWPEMLPAAGVTFLFLSIGGILEAIAEWNHANGQGITFGSFHLTRQAFAKPSLSHVVQGVLGVSQLAVECATGLRCLMLYRRMRRSTAPAPGSSKPEGARRARLGRLAIYVSVGFLVLMIRLPVWSTYIEILNDSRIVREFVLKTDFGPTNRPRRGIRMSKEEQRLRGLQQTLTAALMSTGSGNYLAAKEDYLALIARADSVDEKTRPPGYDTLFANAENNLAWLLATCPKMEVRDSHEAVRLARSAIAREPATGTYWNTLGVALYRDGELDAAHDALSQSMQLRGDGGDSFDWFFLAMIDQKQGRKEKAREVYEKAVKWYHADPDPAANGEELYRFEVEAAETLGLPKPSPRPSAPRPRMNRPLPTRVPPAPNQSNAIHPSPEPLQLGAILRRFQLEAAKELEVSAPAPPIGKGIRLTRPPGGSHLLNEKRATV